jgi:chemotaxis protein MotB
MRMNERANNLLKDAEARAKIAEGKTKGLQDQISARDAALNLAKQSRDRLEQERREQDAAYAKLKAGYDKLLAGLNNPPDLGPTALPAEMNLALKNFASAHDVLEFLPKYGMVKLKADLTFPSGSATVQAGAAGALSKLAEILNKPVAAKFSAYVAGHTDDQPVVRNVRRHPDNWYLSVHRAVGVQKALADAGLAPERIAAMGFGEHHPVAPNKPNKKGNRLNRRVEIWIVPSGKFLTGMSAKSPQK